MTCVFFARQDVKTHPKVYCLPTEISKQAQSLGQCIVLIMVKVVMVDLIIEPDVYVAEVRQTTRSRGQAIIDPSRHLDIYCYNDNV